MNTRTLIDILKKIRFFCYSNNSLPKEYDGKSLQEIAVMHQKAKKFIGKQSMEIGELRKVVNYLIKTQLVCLESTAKKTKQDREWVSLTEYEIGQLAVKYVEKLPNSEIFHLDLFASAYQQELRKKNYDL